MAKTINSQKKKDVFRAYERAIKELGEMARHVSKETIVDKAMSYPAPRYYVTAEVASRIISLMNRGREMGVRNPLKRQMYESLFAKYNSLIKKDGYRDIEILISTEAPSFFVNKRQFSRIVNEGLRSRW